MFWEAWAATTMRFGQKKDGNFGCREEGSWASSGRWASCGLYGGQADGGWHGDGGHVLGLVDEDLATFPALLPCREGFLVASFAGTGQTAAGQPAGAKALASRYWPWHRLPLGRHAGRVL